MENESVLFVVYLFGACFALIFVCLFIIFIDYVFVDILGVYPFPVFKINKVTNSASEYEEIKVTFSEKELKERYPLLDWSKTLITLGTHFSFDDSINKLTDMDSSGYIKAMSIVTIDSDTFEHINSHSHIVIDCASYIDSNKHIKCWLKK